MPKRFEKLPVQLSNDEVRLKGEELAQQRKAWEAKKAERKAVAARLKEELDELDDKICTLADQVKNRREHRDVEVAELKDFEQGKVDTVRSDTGEVVRSRAMTGGERQVSLLSTGARHSETTPKGGGSKKKTKTESTKTESTTSA